MPLVNLTNAEIQTLKEVLKNNKGNALNTPSRPSTLENLNRNQDYSTPEIYLAKPQDSSGIPAEAGDVAGEADCDIYKIQLNSGTPNIVKIGSWFKTVYNIGTVVSQALIPVVKTKYGRWIALPSGGSACDFIRFRIITANVLTTPKTATVDILARPDGCTTVKEETDLGGTGTGETLIVYDKSECWLNEPATDLVDRIGHAKFLVAEGDETLTGTGTITNPGDWEIIYVCCPACTEGTGTG